METDPPRRFRLDPVFAFDPGELTAEAIALGSAGLPSTWGALAAMMAVAGRMGRLVEAEQQRREQAAEAYAWWLEEDNADLEWALRCIPGTRESLDRWATGSALFCTGYFPGGAIGDIYGDLPDWCVSVWSFGWIDPEERERADGTAQYGVSEYGLSA